MQGVTVVPFNFKHETLSSLPHPKIMASIPQIEGLAGSKKIVASKRCHYGIKTHARIFRAQANVVTNLAAENG